MEQTALPRSSKTSMKICITRLIPASPSELIWCSRIIKPRYLFLSERCSQLLSDIILLIMQDIVWDFKKNPLIEALWFGNYLPTLQLCSSLNTSGIYRGEQSREHSEASALRSIARWCCFVTRVCALYFFLCICILPLHV